MNVSSAQCEYRFPLPRWMGPDQDEPCRCDLGVGHTIPHSCSHLRGEKPTGQVEIIEAD